jgi:hypothetical protein
MIIATRFICDEPRCDASVNAETSTEWGVAYKAGWRSYWTDDPEAGGVLRHHCPDHPVKTSTDVTP